MNRTFHDTNKDGYIPINLKKIKRFNWNIIYMIPLIGFFVAMLSGKTELAEKMWYVIYFVVSFVLFVGGTALLIN